MEISCNKKKNPRSNMQQKEDKASREEEAKVENQLQQKQNPKSMISMRKTKLQEKEAKMTQNQIINEKTWQEEKKIATSKKILTNTKKKNPLHKSPAVNQSKKPLAL
jgi:hypothetical protein